MNKLARMCMVFCALLFMLLGIAHADETVATTETYTVKRGDWLAKIARKFHRTDYLVIAKANDLANPDLIHIGQVLVIPSKTETVAAPKPAVKNPIQTAKTEECAPNSEPAEVGLASWYGIPYHGRRTASGEIYDMNALTVAHPTLPLGTTVCITSKQNGASVVAKVNDRGPFIKPRIIDLSKRIAGLLGIERAGIGMVSVSVLALPSAVPHQSRRQRVVSALPSPDDAQAPPILSIDRAEAATASVPPENTLGYIDKEKIRGALIEVVGDDHDLTLLTEHVTLALQMKILRETRPPPNIPQHEHTALTLTQKEEWPIP